jgi:lycopene beta-cyclase
VSSVHVDADVVVVGAGPAGCALASALMDLGVVTLTVDPSPGSPWRATYGMWIDELPTWVARRVPREREVFASRWSTVRVAGHRIRELARPYGRLDNDVLREALTSGETLAATVRGASHYRWGSRVHTTSGEVATRLVVDATGAAGVLGPPVSSDAAQVAYGLVVPSDAVPEPWRPPGGCTLMDWRQWAGASTPDISAPTFLYVLDDGRQTLIEETSLVARPPAAVDTLRQRLIRRLGVDLHEVALDHEVVHIPMASGRPRRDRGDRVVTFGAAAGYVHPATGYSVAASLRAASRVAAAIASALDGGDGAIVAERAANAVWPMAQRRVRALHDVGLAALEQMNATALRTFFDAFFELPLEQWAAYLRVDATPADISRAMSGVFRRVPARQKLMLMGAHPRGVVSVAWPGGS